MIYKSIRDKSMRPFLLVFVVCVAIFGFAVDVRAQVKETIGFERANKSID
jgi:hypothetical protein